MNSRERVLTALERRQPDRVPVCEFTINSQIQKQLCGTCTYLDMIEELDLDAVVVLPSRADLRKISEDTYQDQWGTVYRDTGEQALIEVEYPVASPQDLSRIKPPDPSRDGRLARLEETISRFKGKRAVIFCISDAFSGPRKLLGMETLLVNYVTDPGFVQEIVEMCVDYNVRLLEEAISRGAEIIFSADDYAGMTGPLMSPAHFEQFVFPGLQRVVQAAQTAGAKYIKHTDGDLWSILDLIVQTGIDGLHPIDPNAGMDIFEVKKKYGDHICLIGNVDCEYTLCEGTEREVVEEVQRLIAGLAPVGGYMVASSNSIHNGVNPRNFLTMIRAAREFGKYPVSE